MAGCTLEASGCVFCPGCSPVGKGLAPSFLPYGTCLATWQRFRCELLFDAVPGGTERRKHQEEPHSCHQAKFVVSEHRRNQVV